MSQSPKGVGTELVENGELFRQIILIGIAVCVVLTFYHRFAIGLGGVAGLVAPATGLLMAAILAVFHFRRSLELAAALFLSGGLAAVTGLAVLNGGLAFHVLMWGLLIPVAVPANWPRFFALSTIAVVCVYTTLFVLEITGHSPTALVDRSEFRGLTTDFLSLFIVGALVIIISRSKSKQTFKQIRSRDKFQRALLQSQKLGSLGRVTDSLVHDFNNVLMTMDYSLFLLRRTIAKEAPSLEEVEILETSVHSAIELSNRLAAMGTEGSRQDSLLDVDAVVAELEKVARRVCHPEIQLSVELGCGQSVSIRRVELDQILLNLVVNASDAIGGKGTIVIKTHTNGESINVDVIDSGPGIDAELEEKLFDAFFTTKEAGDGSGLGLWSSQTVARECGGELALVPTTCPGATLRLVLPMTSKEVGSPTKRLTEVERAKPSRARVGALAPTTRSCQRLFGPLVQGVSEPRSRLWGIVIAAIGTLGAVFWWGFATWYWLGFGATTIASVMVAVGLCNGLSPLVIRFTNSVPFAMVLLGLADLIGLAVIVVSRGGFPLQVLVFLLILPLLATMQREYRWLGPLAIGLCSTLVVGSFALALAGIGPEPTLVLSAKSQAIESFSVLLAALTLLAFSVRVGYSVDDQIASEGERFRLALLRAEKAETLGIFASSIAHDLNNILMSVDFGIAFLDESLPSGHRGRPELVDLTNAGNRIRSLSKELVRFGRNDETDTKTVKIDHSLRSLESMARPLIGRHVKLDYQLSAPSSEVAIPAKRFEQLILNLLLSGRQSGSQSVAIHTKTDERNVFIKLLGVDSSGSQRTNGHAETLNDEFVQSMWLCKSIVEDGGGQMSQSQGPKEPSLTIRLPLKRQKRGHARLSRREKLDELPSTVYQTPIGI